MRSRALANNTPDQHTGAGEHPGAGMTVLSNAHDNHGYYWGAPARRPSRNTSLACRRSQPVSRWPRSLDQQPLFLLASVAPLLQDGVRGVLPDPELGRGGKPSLRANKNPVAALNRIETTLVQEPVVVQN